MDCFGSLEKPAHGGTIVENLIVHGKYMGIRSMPKMGLDQYCFLFFVMYGVVLRRQLTECPSFDFEAYARPLTPIKKVK